MLPAECPLLPFTAELDSWSGGFFPAAIHSAKRAEQCADPLKNFQNCGSACPGEPTGGTIKRNQNSEFSGLWPTSAGGGLCRGPMRFRVIIEFPWKMSLRIRKIFVRRENQHKDVISLKGFPKVSKILPKLAEIVFFRQNTIRSPPIPFPSFISCFCRVPYLLRHPSDPASECVLPQQCPLPPPPPPPPLLSPPYITVFPHPSADVVQTATCSAAHNKTWTRCFSQKLAKIR